MNATISARPTLQPIPTAWEFPVANFETQLRARGLREASVDTRVRHLRRLARDLGGVGPLDVAAEDLRLFGIKGVGGV